MKGPPVSHELAALATKAAFFAGRLMVCGVSDEVRAYFVGTCAGYMFRAHELEEDNRHELCKLRRAAFAARADLTAFYAGVDPVGNEATVHYNETSAHYEAAAPYYLAAVTADRALAAHAVLVVAAAQLAQLNADVRVRARLAWVPWDAAEIAEEVKPWWPASEADV
jgi:hypothetical protein